MGRGDRRATADFPALHAAFTGSDPKHLQEIDAALSRMDELIEETLSVARSGTQVDDPYDVALVELASDAWTVVETETATYETVGDRTLQVDPLRAKQLFENLFRNAIEHGSTSPDSQTRQDAVEHGREDVHIRVGPCDGGFFVADDGPGIPEDERDEVLEQGYSTAADGSGLGLAIIRAIATPTAGRSRSPKARPAEPGSSSPAAAERTRVDRSRPAASRSSPLRSCQRTFVT